MLEARFQWEELAELRVKLLNGEGSFKMPELFDWDESCDHEGNEHGWFEITDLGRRTQEYGKALEEKT